MPRRLDRLRGALLGLQGSVRRLGRALGRTRPAGESTDSGPLLSVIVPVYNVETYLAECLDSLIGQTLQEMQFIVVDDGSTDGSVDILTAYAERDPRFVVLHTRSNGGPGAARNRGVAAATGRYITFLDSDDTVPRTAYGQMVDTLERTGSDFALGAVRRVRHGKRTVPAWTRNVHTVERLAVTIDDFPEAMQDVIACNRMFRRDFWNDRIGTFEEGVAYEDHVPMVAAYLRARTFDVLSAFTYNWRIRENATSMGQQKHRTTNLHDRLRAEREALGIVSAEASDLVRAAWLGRVINTDLPVFVPAALVAGDDYRAALQAAAADFLALAGPDALRHARADRKLTTALVAAGRWDEVDRLTQYVRLNGILPETTVVDGRVVATLPFGRDLDLPAEIYELGAHQSALIAAVSGVRWEPDRTLRLEGWAYIRGVDLTDTVPEHEVWLQRLDKDQVLPIPVEHRIDLAATAAANDPNQRYDHAGFRVTIPAERLPEHGRWQLRLRVRVAGVERTGAVHSLSRFGVWDRMPSSPTVDPQDPVRIVLLLDEAEGLLLQIRSDRFRAVQLGVESDGRLTGTVRALAPLRSRPTETVLVAADERLTAPVTVTEHGDLAFKLAPPSTDRAFSLQVRTEDGKRHRVAWPADTDTEGSIRHEARDVGWSRTPRGLVQAAPVRPRGRVDRVETNGGELKVTVAIEKADVATLDRAVLASDLVTVAATSVGTASHGRWVVTFPMTARAWPGSEPLPLAADSYTLAVPGPEDADELPLVSGSRLLMRLPYELTTDTHLVTVTRASRSTQLQLRLAPPLRADERGRAAQRRLAARYRNTDVDPADQVLFQCYRGELAGDNQLAIHEELRRRSSPLDLVWAVADRAVPLPPGARGVLIGSWEWYEALGRSRYLCTNIDFERFFERRPHQRFLQTFRGYPNRAMGIPLWRSEGYTEQLIAAECERRARAWSSIVVADAFGEDLYRRAYRYQGDALVTGYPRTDALVHPPAGRRDRVRERLGLTPDASVVLYAPTWRDDRATGEWSARLFDELDLERLAAALGPQHTVLLRGHPYNLADARALRSGRLAGVVDVTSYPEVNDLILAADVAVLDYSSLRFDWLLTGKPLLFFVPDLEQYLGRWPVLFDFAETAPGPLLRTTDEVIAALRDLPSVAEEHAGARAVANRRFNALHDGYASARVVSAFFSDADVPAEPDRPEPRAGGETLDSGGPQGGA
jgi:CDP-glycerol glycerophosphotransferase